MWQAIAITCGMLSGEPACLHSDPVQSSTEEGCRHALTIGLLRQAQFSAAHPEFELGETFFDCIYVAVAAESF